MTRLSAVLIGASAVAMALSTFVVGPAQATEAKSAPAAAAVINTFKNRHTGACVDSNAAGHAYALTCNAGNYQNWEVTNVGGASRELKNAQTKLCLDDSDYYGLRTVGCNSQQYQRWDKIVQPNGISLRNVATGRCLDDSDQGLRTVARNNLDYQIWW